MNFCIIDNINTITDIPKMIGTGQPEGVTLIKYKLLSFFCIYFLFFMIMNGPTNKTDRPLDRWLEWSYLIETLFGNRILPYFVRGPKTQFHLLMPHCQWNHWNNSLAGEGRNISSYFSQKLGRGVNWWYQFLSSTSAGHPVASFKCMPLCFHRKFKIESKWSNLESRCVLNANMKVLLGILDLVISGFSRHLSLKSANTACMLAMGRQTVNERRCQMPESHHIERRFSHWLNWWLIG